MQCCQFELSKIRIIEVQLYIVWKQPYSILLCEHSLFLGVPTVKSFMNKFWIHIISSWVSNGYILTYLKVYNLAFVMKCPEWKHYEKYLRPLYLLGHPIETSVNELGVIYAIELDDHVWYVLITLQEILIQRSVFEYFICIFSGEEAFHTFSSKTPIHFNQQHLLTDSLHVDDGSRRPQGWI